MKIDAKNISIELEPELLTKENVELVHALVKIALEYSIQHSEHEVAVVQKMNKTEG